MHERTDFLHDKVFVFDQIFDGLIEAMSKSSYKLLVKITRAGPFCVCIVTDQGDSVGVVICEDQEHKSQNVMLLYSLLGGYIFHQRRAKQELPIFNGKVF